jgi:hypothetical protein
VCCGFEGLPFCSSHPNYESTKLGLKKKSKLGKKSKGDGRGERKHSHGAKVYTSGMKYKAF